MTKETQYQFTKNNFFEDFFKSINKLKKYSRRIIIIDDLIYDIRLRKEYNWNLKFITDFHQICEVAFPRLMKISAVEINNKITPKLAALKDEEKREVVRDRIRKSIPFFNVNQLKEPPILLPMYHGELMSRLDSQFYSLVTEGIQNYIQTKKVKVSSIREMWLNSMNQLLSLESGENISDTKEGVKDFTDLTVIGYYYLLFVNLIGTRIINFLIQDTTPYPHVKIIDNENEEYTEVKKLSYYMPWYYLLKRKKAYSFIPNLNDAMAISDILTWNRILDKKGEKEIYFLISDAEILWNLLRETEELPEEPIVNNLSLPSFCKNKINILRTSYHFEEYIMSFDENHNLFIKKLEARKKQIEDNFGDFKFEIREAEERCMNKEGNCLACDYFEKCKTLKFNIDRFFSTEKEFTKLLNIIYKDKTFKALLEFTNKFIKSSQEIKSILPDSIFRLEKNYTVFFTKDYNKYILENFHRVLDSYQEEYFNNIKSIYILLNISFNETNIEFRNRLKRVEFLNIKETFIKNYKIKNFLSIIFKGKDLAGRVIREFSYRKEIIAIIEKYKSDIETELLRIIILFCQEKYKYCYTLVNHYIKDKRYIEEIKSLNLEVEFQIILYLTKFMVKIHNLSAEYNMEEKIPKNKLKKYLETFNCIIKNLKILEKKFYNDPRVPYFIARIYSLEYFFKLDRKTSVLEDSIKYLDKAIYIVKPNNMKVPNKYSDILFLLYNLKLWCILNISLITKKINEEIENLYELVKNCSFHYTFSEYFYCKFVFEKDEEEKLKYLKSSISELEKAITLGEEKCNSSEELKIFKRRRDILITELASLKNILEY